MPYPVTVGSVSPSEDILVVDADLMALARIREAAGRAGMEVRTTPGAAIGSALEKGTPRLIVLDLDRGGTDLVGRVAEALAQFPQSARVLAFFSHVNEDLGRAAQEAGFETFPRGQFWRSLDELFA